ncbi:hypothetical protein H6796_02430 [Candidatus Nomurabacteria bacterium]|nr:hypothetical protein [Candidatus Nomurabacteria bacterium]
MPKKSQNKFSRLSLFLLLVVLLLSFALAAAASTLPKHRPKLIQHKGSSKNISHVSLGAMEYDLSSGRRATKTTSPLTDSLRAFLKAEGKKSLGKNCRPVYHNVVAWSDDKKQVLLSYGCITPSIGMFAVYENDEWKLISPTNQFNEFGTPLCSHVNENRIDRKIAPVCYEVPSEGTDELKYVVR